MHRALGDRFGRTDVHEYRERRGRDRRCVVEPCADDTSRQAHGGRGAAAVDETVQATQVPDHRSLSAVLAAVPRTIDTRDRTWPRGPSATAYSPRLEHLAWQSGRTAAS